MADQTPDWTLTLTSLHGGVAAPRYTGGLVKTPGSGYAVPMQPVP